MADELFIRLDGIDELVRVLKAAPDKIRKRAVRQALRKAALLIRADARTRAPVLRAPAPFRKPGTVKRRISVRNSKFARQAGDEGVFVGVRPLRGSADTRRYGKANARNPNDPYYWWWQEFGWVPAGPGKARTGGTKSRFLKRGRALASGARQIPGKNFLGGAASSKGGEAIRMFLRESLPAIQKLNSKGA